MAGITCFLFAALALGVPTFIICYVAVQLDNRDGVKRVYWPFNTVRYEAERTLRALGR